MGKDVSYGVLGGLLEVVQFSLFFFSLQSRASFFPLARGSLSVKHLFFRIERRLHASRTTFLPT